MRGLSQRGVPFSWAGGGINGPTRGTGTGINTVGFDASGLMQYAYAGAGTQAAAFLRRDLPGRPEGPAAAGTEGRPDLLRPRRHAKRLDVPRKQPDARGRRRRPGLAGARQRHDALPGPGYRQPRSPAAGADRSRSRRNKRRRSSCPASSARRSKRPRSNRRFSNCRRQQAPLQQLPTQQTPLQQLPTQQQLPLQQRRRSAGAGAATGTAAAGASTAAGAVAATPDAASPVAASARPASTTATNVRHRPVSRLAFSRPSELPPLASLPTALSVGEPAEQHRRRGERSGAGGGFR